MEPDYTHLTRLFHDMSDDELMRRYTSGNLTEAAQSIAREELLSRGQDAPLPFGFQAKNVVDEEAPDPAGFKTVARFFNPVDAHIAKAALESAGIPVFLLDVNQVHAMPFMSIALGGVSILVPASRDEEARNIIESIERGDFGLADGDLTWE